MNTPIRLTLGLWLSAIFFSAPLLAQTADSSTQALIDRIQSAGQTLSFAGTFVHQQDSILNTSRIVQSSDARQQMTRVQALEGNRQEVVKGPGEIRFYMPERQMVKVDRTGQPRAAFPIVFVGPSSSVLRNYDLTRAGSMRIADVDTAELVFKPRHELRWAVRLWVDKRTSLIVKCQKLNAEGQAVEQIAFTELSFSAKPQPVAMTSSFSGAKDWPVHDVTLMPTQDAPTLKFKPDTLKGFELAGVYQRVKDPSGGEGSAVRRYVYTDGIALVSVFVQPKSSGGPLTDRAQRKGALTMLSREIKDSWVTVIGDLPSEALRQFANTIEWK